MDIATLLGTVSAFGLVLIAIIMGGGLSLFINIPSLMIVVGGTLGATMINYPLKDVLGALRAPKIPIFDFEPPQNPPGKLSGLAFQPPHPQKEAQMHKHTLPCLLVIALLLAGCTPTATPEQTNAAPTGLPTAPAATIAHLPTVTPGKITERAPSAAPAWIRISDTCQSALPLSEPSGFTARGYLSLVKQT